MNIEKEQARTNRNFKIGIAVLIALTIASGSWMVAVGVALFRGLTA